MPFFDSDRLLSISFKIGAIALNFASRPSRQFQVNDAAALQFAIIEVEKAELKQISSKITLILCGLSAKRIGEYESSLGTPTPISETDEWKSLEVEWPMKNLPYKLSEFKGTVAGNPAFPVRLLSFATLLPTEILVDQLPNAEELLDSEEEDFPPTPITQRTTLSSRQPSSVSNTSRISSLPSQASINQGLSRQSSEKSVSRPPSRGHSQISLRQREEDMVLSQEPISSQKRQAAVPSAPTRHVIDLDDELDDSGDLMLTQSSPAKPKALPSRADLYIREPAHLPSRQAPNRVSKPKLSQPLITSTMARSAPSMPPPAQLFSEEDDEEELVLPKMDFSEPPHHQKKAPIASELSDYDSNSESDEAPARGKRSRMVAFGGMGDEESSDDDSEDTVEELDLPALGRAAPNHHPSARMTAKANGTYASFADHDDFLDQDDIPQPRRALPGASNSKRG